MPVAIEYSPVGAIAAAAGDVYSRRQMELQQELAQQNAARQAEYANQGLRARELSQRDQQFYVEQNYRDRALEQQGAVAEARIGQDAAELDFRREEADRKAPQQYTDESGTYELTPEQAAGVHNLSQLEDPGSQEYRDGLRKILGIQQPMYDYQTPDGQTVRVTGSQYGTFSQRDAAAQAKAERDAAAAEQRASVHSDMISLQTRKIDLEAEKSLLAVKKASAEELRKNQEAIDETDDKMQTAAEKAARIAVEEARSARDDYVQLKQPSVGDKELERRQGWVIEALAAEKKVIEQGILRNEAKKARQVAAPAPTAAPATAPAPAAPAPKPAGGKPLEVGSEFQGSKVIRTGKTKDGTKVYQLANGKVVDEAGKEVSLKE